MKLSRRLTLHFAQIASLLYILVFAVAYSHHFTGQLTAGIALSLTAALAPTSLVALYRSKPKLIKIAGYYAAINGAAELTIVLLSLVAAAITRAPVALTGREIITIDIIAVLLPLGALRHEKNHGKQILNGLGFGIVAGAISYGNYLVFFARHSLSPHYLDPSLPLNHQATTLAMMTLILCFYLNVLFERAQAHDRFLTSHLWKNQHLLRMFGVSLVLILAIIYTPLLQKVFSTGALSPADWLTTFGAALLYALARLLQRHTRQHTRNAVIDLVYQMHANQNGKHSH
jgi:magnesium-transporting ATPase (P-type)